MWNCLMASVTDNYFAGIYKIKTSRHGYGKTTAILKRNVKLSSST